ncbi:8-amino-7-oxononanoate synthase [Chitinophaga horti]|uniref:8-amino-7-oxononanoate synthase n=1 Tax=Chitinophaga horti TaxID=2920382 RepID=A0ABY6J7W6_9BACT|nr:8-amino-7-oxononanoate synthase [Chitinophaga horti]UYQ94397.1 8-amino-7-oxononanoate synthase [Chitinophaga horti]
MLQEDFLSQALSRRLADESLRRLQLPPARVDFCSNDYLGLARSEALGDAAQAILTHVPPLHGSGGSRLLAGNYPLIEEAEQRIAALHDAGAGLLFNSGYDANVGLFASVPQKGDFVIHDQLIHASILDGIRLSDAQRLSFRHNDLAHLEQKLFFAKEKGRNVFVAVESVYSMDGDAAPLTQIAALCAREGAYLIVDEAHATGVCGPRGMGLVQAYGLEQQCFARVHTFGKAVGCNGAIVLGSPVLKEYLVNFARSFIYTTALPPMAIATILASYLLFPGMDGQRAHLQLLIHRFREALPVRLLLASDTAIQIVKTPGNQRARALAHRLQQAGLDVRAILHPTVARGAERLRVVLHAFNTVEEVDLLTSIVADEVSDTTAAEERADAGSIND